jgi:Ca-activated chloride channel family protein
MRWDAPWLLLLLLLVPWLVWRVRRPAARRAALLWGRTTGAWAVSRGAFLVKLVTLLPWLVLIVSLVSLARPQQGIRQTETETRGVDIVLAIDLSPSMRAEDFRPRNRLYVAKETARSFIKQRDHDRVGLVGFAGTSFTVCPLTLDHDVLLELLDGLDFGLVEDGTAIGMGLATAVARLKESKTPSKVVILLTDGQNNRGAIDPLTGAELARAFGIKVYTVLAGRGGVVPVPIDDPLMGRRVQMVRMEVDETTLRQIAERTGGRFYRATDPRALEGIYSEIDRLERAPIRSVDYRDYQDLGPWLLGWAAVALAFHALSASTWATRLP